MTWRVILAQQLMFALGYAVHAAGGAAWVLLPVSSLGGVAFFWLVGRPLLRGGR